MSFFYNHFFRQVSPGILKIHFNQFKINKETAKSLGPESSNLCHAGSDESAPARPAMEPAEGRLRSAAAALN